MAVVSMMRIPGDPDELVGKMQEVMAATEELADKHGGLMNIVARDGDDGLLVINVWETDEGRHAMAEEPAVRDAVGSGNFPEPHFEGYEIISLRMTERGRSAGVA